MIDVDDMHVLCCHNLSQKSPLSTISDHARSLLSQSITVVSAFHDIRSCTFSVFCFHKQRTVFSVGSGH
jgi:hypothetical protein